MDNRCRKKHEIICLFSPTCSHAGLFHDLKVLLVRTFYFWASFPTRWIMTLWVCANRQISTGCRTGRPPSQRVSFWAFTHRDEPIIIDGLCSLAFFSFLFFGLIILVLQLANTLSKFIHIKTYVYQKIPPLLLFSFFSVFFLFLSLCIFVSLCTTTLRQIQVTPQHLPLHLILIHFLLYSIT